MIRIVICDDHGLVRAGIRGLLDTVHDFEVVGEAASGEQAVAQVRALRPDVVLMDIDMPGIGGLEATRRIVRMQPSVRVVGLSEYRDGPYPMHMFDAGAVGYLSKGSERADLESAVRSVTYGQHYLNGEVARNLMMRRMRGDSTPIDELSRRELEVLVQLSKARSLRDIAAALCISPKTVSTYRTRVCRKLGVNNDVQLAHVALRYGLLDPATM